MKKQIISNKQAFQKAAVILLNNNQWAEINGIIDSLFIGGLAVIVIFCIVMNLVLLAN